MIAWLQVYMIRWLQAHGYMLTGTRLNAYRYTITCYGYMITRSQVHGLLLHEAQALPRADHWEAADARAAGKVRRHGSLMVVVHGIRNGQFRQL